MTTSGSATDAKGLIDTGAIVALLNPKDLWHEQCVEAFESLRLPLATTTAVLTEVFHFVQHQPTMLAAAWIFFRSGAVTIRPIRDDDLPALERLMKKYCDRPTDFADATLVHLARRESLSTVFTTDHADFQTYRIHGKRRFRIIPA